MSLDFATLLSQSGSIGPLVFVCREHLDCLDNILFSKFYTGYILWEREGELVGGFCVPQCHTEVNNRKESERGGAREIGKIGALGFPEGPLRGTAA